MIMPTKDFTVLIHDSISYEVTKIPIVHFTNALKRTTNSPLSLPPVMVLTWSCVHHKHSFTKKDFNKVDISIDGCNITVCAKSNYAYNYKKREQAGEA